MNWRGLYSICVLVTLIFTMTFIFTGSAAAQKYDLKPYSPLKKGITWNYLQTYIDGSKDYEVACVGGTETVRGKVTKKMWEFDSGELEDHDYSYDCKAWTTKGLKLYKSVTSTGSYIIYDPPAVILPATMRVGGTFQFTSTRTSYDPSGIVKHTGPYTIELTLMGKEVITVRSGRYNCLKFSGSVLEAGDWADFTMWLASGIGEVKKVLIGIGESELMSFTMGDNTYFPVN
jgi:hypothetical protein